jgi:anti-sigma regulatory factor (Ser/Thr protein kinase)
MTACEGPYVLFESDASPGAETAGRDVAGAAITEGEVTFRRIALAGEGRSVAYARRFVRDVLGASHPALDDVALCASELATNAIKHTASGDGGEITIALGVSQRIIRIEVTDDAATGSRPHAKNDPEGEYGRGILIVDTIADGWGVTERAGATTVWAEFHNDEVARDTDRLMGSRQP